MPEFPYLPQTKKDIDEMMEVVGVKSISELFSDIPERFEVDISLPESKDEFTVLRDLSELSKRNLTLNDMSVFRGAGVYKHFVPSAVQAIASRGEFLTAYTPYQAEVSQGTLQMLFEFQTMICELTGMEVANSSMYDGASAVAEAALMAVRVKGGKKVLVSEALHPEYVETIKTYCFGSDIDVETVAFDSESGQIDVTDLQNKLTEDISGFVLGYPNFFGIIENLSEIRSTIGEHTMMIVSTNPIALGILEAPGMLGADIVVGDGQPLGNAPSFGGPGLGFFASKESYIRKMPGRIIGETKDNDGRTGYVMVLQTREQHIRRSKATSNICSNHAFNALIASIYMSMIGSEGLREIAKRSFDKAHYLSERISRTDHVSLVFTGPFFNEFVARFDCDLKEFNKELLKDKILGPLELERFNEKLKDCGLICTTEANLNEEVEFFAGRLEAIG
ncbi:aminomethyl-transferring glycine dehydrogenase subunit GcvPA [Mesotoga prima]|uniref:aminomethyl-transferring glycine dehydrogenase subunit GcvPA n=1 Tax=Mesotoga prima TaxID=1184387 RepID=UPI002594520E|nr:aminomethyl-transferring glycine dehydrogenase subunit GcvPA [Mesotoga prima]HNQ70898.1 aminomethyl-transferring glycine dehydrogenase subunit GcvPA [Mesotoga prima]